jgi:hypothetical protein
MENNTWEMIKPLMFAFFFWLYIFALALIVVRSFVVKVFVFIGGAFSFVARKTFSNVFKTRRA